MENNEELIELKVLGITRSEVQPGAYALLLRQLVDVGTWRMGQGAEPAPAIQQSYV